MDDVSRPRCKQCGAKPTKTKWFYEFDRANELLDPLGVHTQIPQVNVITMIPEFTDQLSVSWSLTSLLSTNMAISETKITVCSLVVVSVTRMGHSDNGSQSSHQ